MIAAALLVAACGSASNTASNTAPNTASNTGPNTGVAATTSAAEQTTESGTPSTEPATTPGSAADTTDPAADPTADPTAETSNTSSSTGSTGVSTSTATTFVDVAPAGPCAFTPAVPMGEVTWVQDGQLRALADGGQPTCLLDGITATPTISWSSDAGRALVDPTTSANASGTHPTGFGATDMAVTLSAPTGSATIGIDPANHHLIRHGSDGTVTDISFLATTDEAIYHPSGKRIIAVGTDQGGAYGIWLSSNLGTEPKQILSVDDPTTPVTNLNLSPDGQTLFFIHGFVHRLYVPSLILDEVGVADRDEAHLTISKGEDAQAWTTGPCSAAGTVLMTSAITPEQADLRAIPGSPFAASAETLQPIGWLSGYRLVIAARPSGCDGPADVWIWSTVDGFHHVAHDVLAPSVRIPRGPFTDLPDTIEQAAPG